VGRIELPPLRVRRGDIAVLATEFWRELGGEGALPYELQRRFEAWDWPGNVRELYNEVSRSVALGGLALEPRFSSVPPPPGAAQATERATDFLDRVLDAKLPFSRARRRVAEEFDRRYVERVVTEHDGNIARAAAASGIARRYFQMVRARTKRSGP
jgi:transcriptional regulator with GAF, ATPase, and Fis domain